MRSSSAFRYTLAAVVALAALFLRDLLTPLLGNHDAYHTVWLAVVFSAWYCGLGPSILTALFSALGVWYWFLQPTHSWIARDRADLYGMLGFVLFSGAIIALGESNRRGLAVRSRLAAIVESSDDAIIGKGLDGAITSWNKGAERLFQYTSQEAVGQHITLIVPDNLLAEEAAILERLWRGERVQHFETVRLRKDGTTVDVSLTISPLKDVAGRVVGASSVARDITQHKQAKEAVKEKEFSARLLKLQDEERRRIARELHDGVGQLLTVMSMNVAEVEREKSKLSPETARCVEHNARLIEQVSTDIRTMSYLFHPPLLDEMGLNSALKWYVDGFSERSKIAATLELAEDLDRLPQEYELCLFRIAQECLTNIHRHSGASTARLRLLRSPGEIELEVSDDGKGIDGEAKSKIASGESTGVGLRGMQERVRQLGGSVEIRSNGNGTTVTATVPLDPAG
jgi:PAS domain S-box-containing protein